MPSELDISPWTLIEDKTKYPWMRVQENKIHIMYDVVSANKGDVCWGW